MAEPPITEEDIERLKAGFEHFNNGEFDALREFFAPDVVMTRIGALPPLRGWEQVRTFFEPDAFDSQQIIPLEWSVNHDKLLLRVHIRSRGAGSGLELDTEGWLVWTVVDHLVAYSETFIDESEAKAAFELGQNASS